MQAIILAAGMGRRLGELTQDRPKCMVEVNGVTLIERMLRQLDRCHLDRIVIVVGYRARQLIDFVNTLRIETPIQYVENRVFDKTNNIYSLALAEEYLRQDDTLLLESDLIFEDDILGLLLADRRDSLALVDRYESWMDGTCLTLGADDTIERFVPGNQFRFEESSQYYKTVNVYKFSRAFSEHYYVPFLEAYTSALGNNEYYEQVLRVITLLDHSAIHASKLTGQKWYEIDDAQDLDIACSIFADTAQSRVKNLTKRYGGYWRYPGLLDYCLLVNPYFPPLRLLDELRSSMNTLVTSYPSGMDVNALLAAKDFGLDADQIVVGNGASELIKSIMSLETAQTIGLIAPSFDEYAHRIDGDVIVYVPDNEAFAYSADDVMRYFDAHPVSMLVLVNPDNPSGNYIPCTDLKRVLQWSRERQVRILIDESFIDFSEEDDASLLKRQTLEDNPQLVVIKSISKSHGIPGLRLGIAASGDALLMKAIRHDVAIWNINSLGEFYLQIVEKYRGEYNNALMQLRGERASLVSALGKIPGIEVFPTQANYLMCKLGVMKAAELAAQLLDKYDILIKDLTDKTERYRPGEYIRLAVRSAEDNEKLVAAFQEILADC